MVKKDECIEMYTFANCDHSFLTGTTGAFSLKHNGTVYAVGYSNPQAGCVKCKIFDHGASTPTASELEGYYNQTSEKNIEAVKNLVPEYT